MTIWSGVPVECTTGTSELVAVHVQTVDVLDLRTGSMGEIQGSRHQLVAVLNHLPPPTVQSGVDQHRGAGGAEQVDARLEHGRVDQLALLVEHRALLQAAAHLVHARDGHVRAGVHRPGRQVGVKRQVRAPRLIHNQWPSAFVAHPDDGGKVRTGAVRGR